MERVWVFDSIAVAVAQIDFLDPAVADQPDARERGVRVEIRPADVTASGSIYVSRSMALGPALCRVDLLESQPGACDRMHWHPEMPFGEPCDRVFDPELSGDPIGWTTARLNDLDRLLDRAPVSVTAADRAAVAAAADDIVAAIDAGLAWARSRWPEVDHDERGMALP